MSVDWSPVVLDQTFRLFIQEGRSAAETARMLGGGVTRNAVLGKAQRMGWSRPEPAAVAPCEMAKPRAAAPRPRNGPPVGRDIPLPRLREVPLIGLPRLWTERRADECAFPVGEPAEPGLQLSCCAPTGPGRGYCPAHRALMVMPQSALTEHDKDAILEIARRAA